MVNPYQPPEIVDGKERARVSIGRGERSTSWISLCLVLTGAIFYLGFTAILLTSTNQDRKAGMLFLFNTPAVLAWGGMLFLDLPKHLLAGLVVAFIQAAITVVMIFGGFSDLTAVVAINGLIITITLAIILFCWLADSGYWK